MASTDEKIFNGQDLETYSTLIKQSIENVENQIPTLTSLLINNSNFVADANYVHTDNNYTSQEKTKLSGIEAGAEVNVLSDWNAVSGDAFIKNKPNNIVTDASYVHTDNNYTTAEKNKLAGIASGAEVNVQSDWNQTTTTADDYIKNKPTNVSSFNNDAGYLTEHQDISGKLDVITDLDTIRAGAAAGATAYQKPSTGIPKSDLSSSVLTSLGKADTALLQHQDLSSYADGAEYDSTNHLIYLKHGNTRLANPIDATDFIKDGMVDTVEVTGGNLVITFNTDSGKLPITIPISDIFDANNYYNKTESDNRYLLSYTETDPTVPSWAKQSTKPTYTASEVGALPSNTHIPNDIKVGSVAGKLYRNNVGGTGNFSISGNSGCIPNLTAGTFLVAIYAKSATQNYTFRFNFGSTTYDLSTTNGEINDLRTVTISSAATFSGSVVTSSGVAPGTILYVTMYNYLTPIQTVGPAAVTNRYSDLDGTPTIPTVNNGTLTIQKNGTSVATFTANQSGSSTANITVPTKVSELNNDSGFITGYTETDPTVPSWAKASTKPSYDYSEINNTPTIPTVPTNVSAFNNDAGYLTTHLDISGKQDVLTPGDGIAIDNNDTISNIGIPFGEVDSTSTSTVFTATVPGIDRLENGVCVMLRNAVVTSAANFTININNLGAKPSYNNMALGNPVTPTNPTRDTTIFNINYAMLFVYNEDVVEGGCWICYRGYDANTNTIGYQLRHNSSTLPTTDKFYRYRLLFTSPDGTHYIPANTSTSTNATAVRTVNQRPIDPFGEILYYSTTSAVSAEANPGATYLWEEYTLTLGYSFNRTGAALVLQFPKPIYLKCAPQADGSAIIDADNPYVQELPTTLDGKIYIFLGIAYAATAIELLPTHPIYYHDGNNVRHWPGYDIANILSRLSAIETQLGIT